MEFDRPDWIGWNHWGATVRGECLCVLEYCLYILLLYIESTIGRESLGLGSYFKFA